jgi:hypothetical protein
VLSLDGRHLVIQGPPGSGKTWTAGRLIANLIVQGKRVGVASTSHKAIHNLLDAVEDAAASLGLHFSGIKKANHRGRPLHRRHQRAAVASLPRAAPRKTDEGALEPAPADTFPFIVARERGTGSRISGEVQGPSREGCNEQINEPNCRETAI